LTKLAPSILVYGYGNPGRQDDGLGVKLTEELDHWIMDNHLSGIHTDSNYQLNLEDVASIKDFDMVIFADASRENIEHYSFEALSSSDKVEFTMHAVSPSFILHLCNQVFDHHPQAYLLKVRGYEWEFMEGMTDRAAENLLKAFGYLKEFLLKYTEQPG
jgi:hydrogenase maturation protease